MGVGGCLGGRPPARWGDGPGRTDQAVSVRAAAHSRSMVWRCSPCPSWPTVGSASMSSDDLDLADRPDEKLFVCELACERAGGSRPAAQEVSSPLRPGHARALAADRVAALRGQLHPRVHRGGAPVVPDRAPGRDHRRVGEPRPVHRGGRPDTGAGEGAGASGRPAPVGRRAFRRPRPRRSPTAAGTGSLGRRSTGAAAWRGAAPRSPRGDICAPVLPMHRPAAPAISHPPAP